VVPVKGKGKGKWKGEDGGAAQPKPGRQPGKAGAAVGAAQAAGGQDVALKRKAAGEAGPEDAFAQGEALVEEARAAAAQGYRDHAYSKYCEGLQYLLDYMPGAADDDHQSVQRRQQINSYLKEAEVLKAEMEAGKSGKGGAEVNGPPQKGVKGQRRLPGKGQAAPGAEDAMLRSRIDECEAIMQGAQKLEEQGNSDQAYDEYCRGLRSFLQSARRIGEETTDRNALERKAEVLLSKAVHLKERLDKAGLSVANLFASSRTVPPRSRSPPKQPGGAAAAAARGQDFRQQQRPPQQPPQLQQRQQAMQQRPPLHMQRPQQSPRRPEMQEQQDYQQDQQMGQPQQAMQQPPRAMTPQQRIQLAQQRMQQQQQQQPPQQFQPRQPVRPQLRPPQPLQQRPRPDRSRSRERQPAQPAKAPQLVRRPLPAAGPGGPAGQGGPEAARIGQGTQPQAAADRRPSVLPRPGGAGGLPAGKGRPMRPQMGGPGAQMAPPKPNLPA